MPINVYMVLHYVGDFGWLANFTEFLAKLPSFFLPYFGIWWYENNFSINTTEVAVIDVAIFKKYC